MIINGRTRGEKSIKKSAHDIKHRFVFFILSIAASAFSHDSFHRLKIYDKREWK